MRRGWLLIAAVTLAFSFLVVHVGCETTSHTHIRIYEYDEDREPPGGTRDEDGATYQMESPGEMVSPGTMVLDPP